MSMIRTLLCMAFIIIPATLQAQEAISFERLTELLDPYFAPELIGDVRAALPSEAFDVWGFDVGDFSGDGYNDLVISIRKKRDRGRNMYVYYFADVEGILEKVREENVKFVELPIEVGVTVSNGTAYVIRRADEDTWESRGYRFRDGVVMLADTYATDRPSPRLDYRKSRDYQSLEAIDLYLRPRDGEEIFRADYLVVPSYKRGRHVSSGYAQTATATTTPYIVNGAYYREGPEDLELRVRSAWDADYLYFSIDAIDDEVISLAEAAADSLSDHVEIWLDMSARPDRLVENPSAPSFRMKSDTNIYGFTIDLGDLADQEPGIAIATSNLFDEDQHIAANAARAASIRSDSGWGLRVRIPFRLLGYSEPPIQLDDVTGLGATVVVHDYDSPYRPEEATVIATSRRFDRGKPATFGQLLLIPKGLFYGFSENVYLPEVKTRLEEVGY